MIKPNKFQVSFSVTVIYYILIYLFTYIKLLNDYHYSIYYSTIIKFTLIAQM